MPRPVTVADRRAVAVAFAVAVAEWRAQHRTDAVAAALTTAAVNRRQRRDAVIAALDFDRLRGSLADHLAPELGRMHDAGWQSGTADAERLAGRHDTGYPDAGRLVAERADLLTDSTLEGVDWVLGRAVGMDTWDTAQLVTTVAGLNRPQAGAVLNHHRAASQPPVLSDGTVGKAPSPERVAARDQRIAARKLRERSSLVGWYEPAHAAATGRLEAFQSFGDLGGFAGLDEAGLVPMREWVVGENPCDDCNRMAGTKVGIFDLFPGGEPPRHPSCKCWTVLGTVPSPTAGRRLVAA